MIRAGYVYRPPLDRRHVCPLPAEWQEGALWRCPAGHLWVVDEACECRGNFERHGGRGTHTVGLAWWPATWWQRRRHGGRRARLAMANDHRNQNFAGMKAPPSGLLTPPKDYDG